ncbi:hypothetical protein [Methylorubrum sp. SB2]|uniref:hypothetical protein n=1 Tax=Methylorubrum subtropicum TaxID=3138812 RepID=UPI00313E2D96
MSNFPENHAEMIRIMAKDGYSIEKISFLMRADEWIIEAILRGENPDTTSKDEPDNPIFQGYKGD